MDNEKPEVERSPTDKSKPADTLPLRYWRRQLNPNDLWDRALSRVPAHVAATFGTLPNGTTFVEKASSDTTSLLVDGVEPEYANAIQGAWRYSNNCEQLGKLATAAEVRAHVDFGPFPPSDEWIEEHLIKRTSAEDVHQFAVDAMRRSLPEEFAPYIGVETAPRAVIRDEPAIPPKPVLSEREHKIWQVIQQRVKGPQYLRELHNAGLRPRKNWIDKGCPGTYMGIITDDDWRQRAQDEKSKIKRKGQLAFS